MKKREKKPKGDAVKQKTSKAVRDGAAMSDAEQYRQRVCQALGFGDDDGIEWSWDKLLEVIATETTKLLVAQMIFDVSLSADRYAARAYNAIMGKDYLGSVTFKKKSDGGGPGGGVL